MPETVESASDLTSLPKYPLKAGVDESKVDYSSSTDLELWTTATWTSSNTGVISFKEVSYPYFAPYTVTVAQPKKDTSVTLDVYKRQTPNRPWAVIVSDETIRGGSKGSGVLRRGCLLYTSRAGSGPWTCR